MNLPSSCDHATHINYGLFGKKMLYLLRSFQWKLKRRLWSLDFYFDLLISVLSCGNFLFYQNMIISFDIRKWTSCKTTIVVHRQNTLMQYLFYVKTDPTYITQTYICITLLLLGLLSHVLVDFEKLVHLTCIHLWLRYARNAFHLLFPRLPVWAR